MRIAIIDRDKCKKEKCGYVCQRICPGVKMKDETIVIDEQGFPVISEILCTGCGICVKKCPTKAIKIINLVEEMGKPIFQYGVNSFRLYKLPEIKEGVVGLIGSNGMGKTTALNLLSKKHGKISYKPQNVDRIPDYIKGKVGDLLRKADASGSFEKNVERFELANILDRDIKHLSGGELQRVAICAASLKNAEIFFFDEPSSYLDIEQRLKVAREIRKMKKVLVVEHDLAVLDYLSDYIHIFYGVPAAFGIVSKLKNSRVGINEFLGGFLKEENTRIRDHAIAFDVRGFGSEVEGKRIFSWENFEKKLEDFTLEAEGGFAYEGEVLGILGPNAIGKTTFINSLAEKEGKKIAYKKQYVRINFEGTTQEYLAGARQDIINKLQLEDLLDKDANKLSGGEMQRTEIARVLSIEADLYLLDEPSAFLDIEQRLNFASFLKSFMMKKEACAFVVDHDIVLLDSVSNRLMVFEGRTGFHGKARSPEGKREGMNRFLARMNVTIRRDRENKRPRINKPDSQKDGEQKNAGEYYYWEN